MEATIKPLIEDSVVLSPATLPPAQSVGPETTVSNSSGQNEDFLELRRRVRKAGLLDKQPRYYAMKVVMGVALLAIGLAVIVLVDSLGIQS